MSKTDKETYEAARDALLERGSEDDVATVMAHARREGHAGGMKMAATLLHEEAGKAFAEKRDADAKAFRRSAELIENKAAMK